MRVIGNEKGEVKMISIMYSKVIRGLGLNKISFMADLSRKDCVRNSAVIRPLFYRDVSTSYDIKSKQRMYMCIWDLDNMIWIRKLDESKHDEKD